MANRHCVYIILVILQLLFVVIHCVEYRNYTLYRVRPETFQQLQFIENLSQYYDVDFWREPADLEYPVEFTINPKDKDDFKLSADQLNVKLTTLIDDVQSAFEEQTIKDYISRRTDTFDWRNFYRLRDIYEWLNDLSVAHSTEMEVFSIGKTYENRDILAVKILLNSKTNITRTKVIIEGGIHAREWVSPAFVTFLIHQILNAKDSDDKELKKIAESHEWFFIPVINPDGYEYTHTNNRMWRKNRQRYGRHVGVDLNRNFGIAFGSVGISKKPQENTYCGPHAFSEKESVALADFVTKHSNNLEYYFGFHCYGQYMIIPYAYSSEHSDNYKEVYPKCVEAKNKIAKRYGTKYTLGTAYDTVGYRTSGVSGDWVKKTFKTPYVIIFELRDNGAHGFALPPEFIEPTCWETLDGIKSLMYSSQKLRDQDEPFNKPGNLDAKANCLCKNIVILFLNSILSNILSDW